MSPAENDPRLHQKTGEGLAEVRNLRDALRRSEIKSDSSRASMHQHIWIMLVERVSRVEGNSAAVQEDVSEMRPVTDDVKSWKLIAWMLSASLDLAAWRWASHLLMRSGG